MAQLVPTPAVGSGLLDQTLSPPEDLREDWTSPRTPQRCHKIKSSFSAGLSLTWSHAEAPGLVQTTATAVVRVSATHMSQVASLCVMLRNLCLCHLCCQKFQLTGANHIHPQHQHCRMWRAQVCSRPQGTPDLLVSLETRTSSPLSSFLFHTWQETGRSRDGGFVS